METSIPLLTDTYSHVFTCCFPIRNPLHTLKCGRLLEKHFQILSLISSFWILRKPLTPVKACFSHLSQAIFRKLQSFGLQQEYQNDPEFAIRMTMLPALAFVPPKLVGWLFEHIVTIFPKNSYPLCKYFDETYLVLRNINGARNPLLFPINLWNIFHLVPQGLPRTANLVEEWQR